MTIRRTLFWTSALSIAMLVTATDLSRAASEYGRAPEFAPLATPPGIGLQPLGRAQGFDLGKQTAAALNRAEIAFTTVSGLTLYTYVPNPAGKATCANECAENWKPYLVDTGTRVFGPWSSITRDDGTKQWAYDGKPLYTHVKDVDPGSVNGNSPARFGGRRKNGVGEYVGGGIRGSGARNAKPDVPLPAEWKVALAYPVSNMIVPDGVSIKEVPDATGIALIDHTGRTLYALKGRPKKEALNSPWVPATAPQLAKPVGHFTFAKRPDGIKQWSYLGRPLYTYVEDLAPGDAYGAGVDKQIEVAAVVRYYMPADVSIQRTLGQGNVLATKDGKTLYRRDGFIYQSGGGHSLRRGQPPRPAVGRDIGINARCDAACSKVWHPFLAPADAKPQGFWNIAPRPDGTRQWVYQDYALWTFDGDKAPGDMNGNDAYMTAFSEEAAPKSLLDFGTPADGAPALVWAIAIP